MPTYFGGCDSAGNTTGTASNNDSSIMFWRTYTCPGTGSQAIAECGTFMHGVGATATVRIAIYNSAGSSLLVQSATISVPQNANVDQWCTDATITGTLTGGTTYTLAWTVSTTAAATTHGDNVSSVASFHITDFTTGFPASVPSVDGTFSMYPVRVGVNAAGTKAIPPFRRPRRFFTRPF